MLLFPRGDDPLVYDHVLNSPDRFLFRNARVGHAIQMTSQQFFLLLRALIPDNAECVHTGCARRD